MFISEQGAAGADLTIDSALYQRPALFKKIRHFNKRYSAVSYIEVTFKYSSFLE